MTNLLLLQSHEFWRMAHKSFIPSTMATERVTANTNEQSTVPLAQVVTTNFISFFLVLKVKDSNLLMNIFSEWLK